MTRKPHDNTKALYAYIDAQAKAQTLLAQIQQMVTAHQDTLIPDDIHWGHVGDVQRIIALLEDVVAD